MVGLLAAKTFFTVSLSIEGVLTVVCPEIHMEI
jgi:hypothetical protein